MGEAPERCAPVFRQLGARQDAVRPGGGPVRGAAVPRCPAWRLGMTPPVVRIEWRPCWRIIPSRFPPIQLFERVTEPEDLDAVFELEALTNPRLRDEAG